MENRSYSEVEEYHDDLITLREKVEEHLFAEDARFIHLGSRMSVRGYMREIQDH